MTTQKVNAGTRLVSMILDHVLMSFGAMIFAIPGMIYSFSNAFNISHEQPDSADLFGDTTYIMLIGFAVYFCKDTINGRSPAKRILKLQVVDKSTGVAASPIRCFVRNIFCVLWPLEVIVALVNPGRRIGDFVAGTKVVSFDPAVAQPKTNWAQVGISLALAYGILLLIMIPINNIKSQLKSERVDYVEASFNEQDSKALAQLFADSLGDYLVADVKVYDKIQNEDLKYISIIYRLEENYFADDETFEQLRSSSMSLLLTKFPEKTFVGRMQYVWQSGGNMQARTLPLLDWREKPDHQEP